MDQLSVSDDNLKNRLTALITAGKFSKNDLQLGNVDNTSDLAKPVSTVVQSALNQKVSSSSVGAASGVASLDVSGKVPLAQIPSISVAGGQISDIQVSAPTANQVLTYDGTKWANAAAPSGGGTDLAQLEIVAGIGEATANPQQVVLRGPQAAGANIQANDVVLRAEGGTGAWGSGKIRFQTSAAATVYPIYVSQANTSTASWSKYMYVPSSGFSNQLLLLCLHSTSTTDTISTMTMNSANFTTVSTSISATAGIIKYAYLLNPTSGTVTVNYSAAATHVCQLILFENADLVTDGVSQSTASGTQLSASVPNVREGDMIIDYCLQRTSSYGVTTYSYPNSQSFMMSRLYSTNCQATGTTAILNSVGTGTITMTRTFATAVPALLSAVRVQMFRASSSTVASFSDSLVVSNCGRLQYPLASPSDHYEFFDFGTTPLKFLTPTSPRFLIVRGTNNNSRTIILPRADLLPIGTTFYINASINTSGNDFYIVPRYGGYGFGGSATYTFQTANFAPSLGTIVAVNPNGSSNGFLGATTTRIDYTATNTLCVCRLMNNEGPGMWIISIEGADTVKM